MKSAHLLILGSMVCCTLCAQGPTLNPTEQKMVQAIDADKQPSVNLLRPLVEINPGTKNLEGVRQVGKVLTQRFEPWASNSAGQHQASGLAYLSTHANASRGKSGGSSELNNRGIFRITRYL